MQILETPNINNNCSTLILDSALINISVTWSSTS